VTVSSSRAASLAAGSPGALPMPPGSSRTRPGLAGSEPCAAMMTRDAGPARACHSGGQHAGGLGDSARSDGPGHGP
jgi:hypothetical protein